MAHFDRKPRRRRGSGSRDCICHDEWGKPMMHYRRGKKRGTERTARHRAKTILAQTLDHDDAVLPAPPPLPSAVRGHGRRAGRGGTS